MATRSALINVMAGAARKAARKLLRDFGEVEQLQVSVKGPGEFVSSADLTAERTLKTELAKGRPGYGFLLEEGGIEEGRDKNNRFIVDPLDGTTNFLHGMPHFAISIALEREGNLVAGIVYDPVKDEMFWAEKGVGAYVNERRIRVSARRDLAQSVIATGIPFRGRGDHALFLKTLEPVMAATSGVRRWGVASLDLAYVAAGRFDGFWEFDLKPWDMAAGLVLVREAGGYINDLQGGQTMMDSGTVLATNDYLQNPLRQLLSEAMGGRPVLHRK
ncbi:MAG TPA: inositol monophosphatase family protein [Stellaceae bacterium]|nr:inositol monophosphatase family protein [Stellaceae bacterium]